MTNDLPADVAPATRRLAEAGAVVLPLQNGVGVIERQVMLGVTADPMLGGQTAISVARVGPDLVERNSSLQWVAVGEISGGGAERAERIASALRHFCAEALVSGESSGMKFRRHETTFPPEHILRRHRCTVQAASYPGIGA